MDKLSSILPSSPRVQSVDMTEAAPVRPGTPTFGRPVGVSSFKDRFTVSQEAKDIAFKDTLASVNPKEARGAKVAAEMSKKFFEAHNKPLAEIKTQPGSEAAVDREMEILETMPRILSKVEGPKTQVPASAPETARAGANLDLEA